ncbi:MAG: AAA family ATPase [Bryobacteraceae bacterium]|jgi:general secretion pathway protein A
MSDWNEWPIDVWNGLVRYHRDVLEQISSEMTAGFRAYSWGGVEVGGVLIGIRDGNSFSIADHRPVDCEHANGPSYELTARDRDSMRKAVQAVLAAGLEPVGWYKSVSHRDVVLTEADEGAWAELFPDGVLLILKRSQEGVGGGATFCRADGRIWTGRRNLEMERSASTPNEAESIASPVPETAATVESPVVEAAVPPQAQIAVVEPAAPDPAAAIEPRAPAHAFALTPDPEFFYPSSQHREALLSLEYGIKNRKGFVMLVGDAGTGKTMLLECLTDRLRAADIEYGFIFNSRVTRFELFELLAIDFDLKPFSLSKTAVLLAFNEHLLQRASLGRTTALLIDDAQALSLDVLEEIKLLSNLETRKGKLLQVVVAGCPEFEARLNQPEMAGLRQRFVLRPRLGPLRVEETAEYIRTRLERAGESGAVATLPVEEIHRLSGGVPRLISAICAQLLERRSSGEGISPRTLEEVADHLGLSLV